MAEQLRFIFVNNGVAEVYLPWQMVFYLAAGLAVGVVVSWATSPVAKEKLDNFYSLVRTPVRLGEKVVVPCTLPAETPAPPKRSIFPGTSFEMLVPSRVSVVGFVATWVCVALMIYSFYLIVKA